MGDSETEFTSRKFTLPVELDEQLNQISGEHHGGNRSQCLRSAIRDHQHTLNDQDDFAFKSLAEKVDDLIEEVQELKTIIEKQQNPVQNKNITGTQDDLQGELITDNKDENSDAKRSIHRFLIESEQDSVRLGDITRSLDKDSISAQQAIEELIEEEFVQKESDGDKVSYKIKE